MHRLRSATRMGHTNRPTEPSPPTTGTVASPEWVVPMISRSGLGLSLKHHNGDEIGRFQPFVPVTDPSHLKLGPVRSIAVAVAALWSGSLVQDPGRSLQPPDLVHFLHLPLYQGDRRFCSVATATRSSGRLTEPVSHLERRALSPGMRLFSETPS